MPGRYLPKFQKPGKHLERGIGGGTVGTARAVVDVALHELALHELARRVHELAGCQRIDKRGRRGQEGAAMRHGFRVCGGFRVLGSGSGP